MAFTKENEFKIVELLEKHLVKFLELDQIIIGGDFNIKIGTKVDFIVEDRKEFIFL